MVYKPDFSLEHVLRLGRRSRARFPARISQIFADPAGSRRRALRLSGVSIAYLALFWAALFATRLYLVGPAPGERLVRDSLGAEAPAPSLFGPAGAEQAGADTCRLKGTEGEVAMALGAASSPGDVWLNLPDWNERAASPLPQSLRTASVQMPDWFRLSDTDPEVVQMGPPPVHPVLDSDGPKPASGETRMMPLVKLGFRWQGNAGSVLASAKARQQLANSLADTARRYRLPAICLQPMGTAPDDLPLLRDTMQRAQARLHRDGRQSCLVSHADAGLWRDAGLVGAADHVVALMFRDPVATPPAPLAPQDWFDTTLRELRDSIAAEKLTVALGTFAVDWKSDTGEPDIISYAETARRAAAFDGTFGFTEATMNTSMRYRGADGRRHQVWLLDAISAHNQMVALKRLGIGRVALWSAGLEDPGIWQLLRPGGRLEPAALESVDLAGQVGYEGTGAFHRVVKTPVTGTRTLNVDPVTGLIVCQNYRALPEPYTIRRLSPTGTDRVALTFDDGPDKVFTPKILDVLKREGIPASFFIVGNNALAHQDLVRRIYDEGHEIGSHTFFHTDIGAVPGYQTVIELNALQRLLASITGRNTALFRTPYGRGEGPTNGAEAAAALRVQNLGYVLVGSNVVPPDWTATRAEDLVAEAMRGLAHSGSNVIVLHDGGGDRSETLRALPMLIARLRAEGYSFATLSDLLQSDRRQTMPDATSQVATFDILTFDALSTTGALAGSAFVVIVIVGAIRYLVFLTLALSRRTPERHVERSRFQVAVLIPAYNEAKVIVPTVRAALRSTWRDLQVIVIDDGSTDGTFETVRDAFGDEPRLRLIRRPNGGKWQALATGYARMKAEIAVAIDADTIIAPDAVRKLVRHFEDPGVGAVAGLVRVGNRNRLLTGFQALEYVTAQNIERRAAECWNGILVVPGAIGAWRADAVRRAGLYSGETLAEDADLTVALLRDGWRVAFEPNAIARTEAPDSLRIFMRQRLRWSLGMMQIAFKHRGAYREGHRVGWLSLSDLWFFGVLAGLLAPLADIALVTAMAAKIADAIHGHPMIAPETTTAMILAWLILPLIDAAGAFAAMRLDRRENLRLLALLPLYRLLYRPLLYITTWRAALRALNGQLAGWGKQARRGTVFANEARGLGRRARAIGKRLTS
ncbi:MAG: glycosyltransferase [Paracoccaceae bacterium]